jgi:Flp pilus assembly pilin Flp
VVAGFVAVVILSLGTDQVFHSLGVYPPWGVVMEGTGLYMLALGYRIIYTIVGGYITARLAPHSPVRHAVILGTIGLAVGMVGAIVAINGNLGPAWYGIAVALTGLPCSWLGGVLYASSHAKA